MSLPLFQVDAFADAPFSGNPAAVVLLEQPLEDSLLQKIAAEMNLSETAFISLRSASDSFTASSHFKLRWLTPTCEVNLCGHATIAAAATLFFHAGNTSDELSFDTLSGTLKAWRVGLTSVCIELPLNPCTPMARDEMIESVIQATVGAIAIGSVEYSAGTKKLVLHLDEAAASGSGGVLSTLLRVQPDCARLLAVSDGSVVRGVIVTASGGLDGPDFVSRYFSPWNGIPEDPVTGSAHSVLAHYWRSRLDKTQMTARQCSKRGGNLTVIVDEERQRVKIHAETALVVKGQLFV